MSYCSSCGCEIKKDDLYCPGCGVKVDQPLNQNSTQNQNTEKVEHAFEHVKSITNEINFAEIINTLKSSVLKPVSGGINFVAKAQKSSVISITIILALLQGILGVWRVNQVFSNLQDIIPKYLMYFSSLYSSLGSSSPFNFTTDDLISLNKTINQFKSLITIPYGQIFIGNCAVYLIGVLVLFVCIYLGINILVKSKCSAFTIFKVITISTLPIFTCEIISILVSYFSLYLGIGFLILGILIAVITLAIIVKESLQLKADLCVLVASIASLITFVAYYISVQNFITSNLVTVIKSTINLYSN
ncbi:zinc ribbon domain-containing protein [Clostridium psychrophilum]|uniref:zinc ribbon domain-containing protein n=1 Tax=Clostridium psychrophilum TaxID=132926 RepID=UPI001C0CA99A|nr:zinc ribbon domain-containing protein [Clostridium psychrophilum]MBU3179951.1 hypothetical protein [Clostridium psychrophilum]